MPGPNRPTTSTACGPWRTAPASPLSVRSAGSFRRARLTAPFQGGPARRGHGGRGARAARPRGGDAARRDAGRRRQGLGADDLRGACAAGQRAPHRRLRVVRLRVGRAARGRVADALDGDCGDAGLPRAQRRARPGGRGRVDARRSSSPRRWRSSAPTARAGKIGSEILHNLRAGGFRGARHPVHPAAGRSTGCRPTPRVTDMPGPVDLAVIVVPAARVLGRRRRLPREGRARRSCVISAGFGESATGGPRARGGAARRRSAAPACRLIGPNCMGLLNTDPAVRAERDVLAGLSAGRARGDVDAERRPRPGDSRLRAPAQHRHLDASCRSATRPTSRATTSSSTGRTIRARASSCCTSRASATRASSARSRGASAGPSRSSRSSPGGPTAGARAASSHTGALAAQRRGRGRALPAGRRHPHRHARGAVRRRDACSRISRCRAAGASRSSPTPAARASWPPTPARRTGSSCRALGDAHASPTLRRSCPPPRASATRWT